MSGIGGGKACALKLVFRDIFAHCHWVREVLDICSASISSKGRILTRQDRLSECGLA